jgi:hypothetical protein
LGGFGRFGNFVDDRVRDGRGHVPATGILRLRSVKPAGMPGQGEPNKDQGAI